MIDDIKLRLDNLNARLAEMRGYLSHRGTREDRSRAGAEE